MAAAAAPEALAAVLVRRAACQSQSWTHPRVVPSVCLPRADVAEPVDACVQGDDLRAKVRSSKILVVGAGGIGAAPAGTASAPTLERRLGAR